MTLTSKVSYEIRHDGSLICYFSVHEPSEIKEIASKLKALLRDIKRLADRKKRCEIRSDIEIVA